MKLKELGNTGVMVPEIGLGTWQYTGGVTPLVKGIELGAWLIDTAEMYGTESVVGDAIEEQRDQVFLATKVSGSHLGRQEVMRAARNSLKRLRAQQIDLYQIHWPDPKVPIKETMGAMETLVEEGAVRFIGVSNFSVEELKGAQDAMRKFEIVSNQVPYSLLDRGIERDLLPYCQKHSITVIAYSPLAQGRLAKTSLLHRRRALAALEKVAREVQKTMVQVALNWCLSKPNVIAIPKSDKVKRVKENCKASGWRLTASELAALDEAFR